MCEPLRGKGKHCTNCCIENNDKTYHESEVKSAVAFYKRYRNNPNRLFNEKPASLIDNFKCWMNSGYPNSNYDGFNPMNYMRDHHDMYDLWLFDYCFGDVTKEHEM